MRLVPFEQAHYDALVPNRYCKSESVILSLGEEDVGKFTMLSGDKPLAIIIFRQTSPDEYGAFLLISVDFTAKDCVKLRDFVQMLVEERGAKRVWTASQQVPELASWHKFLGMECTGVIHIEDEPYDVWSMTWE